MNGITYPVDVSDSVLHLGLPFLWRSSCCECGGVLDLSRRETSADPMAWLLAALRAVTHLQPTVMSGASNNSPASGSSWTIRRRPCFEARTKVVRVVRVTINCTRHGSRVGMG